MVNVCFIIDIIKWFFLFIRKKLGVCNVRFYVFYLVMLILIVNIGLENG